MSSGIAATAAVQGQPAYAPPPAQTPVPGYGAPGYPPPAAYSPHAPPAFAPVDSPPPAKSRLPLFLVLGGLALGGAGVAVWAATHGTTPKHADTQASGEEVAPRPDDDDDHGGKPDHDHDDDDRDRDDRPPASDPWATGSGATGAPATPSGSDPWASPPGALAHAAPIDQDDDDDHADHGNIGGIGNIGTRATPIPAGAHLDPPPGFKRIPNKAGWQVYGSSRRVLMILAPLYAGTNEPDELAQKWIADNKDLGLTYAGTTQSLNRPMLSFSGTFNGELIVQYVTLYLTPKYRLAYILQTPVGKDADFEAIGKLLVSGVTLP